MSHPSARAGRQVRAICAVALLAMPAAGQAATLQVLDTVMSGLSNPRGMTFGPDGALYVAEAGRGGDLGTLEGATGTLNFGLSGGISRYLAGVQDRIVSGMASLADSSGSDASGVQDIAFDAGGTMYAVLGLGSTPEQRDTLSGIPGSEMLGTAIRFAGGAASVFADIAAYEGANDPAGDGVDSNPFSIVATPGGLIVSDAGANAVLAVDSAGAISVEAVLPPAPNPLPFGPPTYQAVPTGIALSPDGVLAIGQLTGFPFPVGAAQILTPAGGGLDVIAGGFTNLIDVAYGSDGTLYALEMASNSLLDPSAGGALYSVDGSGTKTLLLGGLLAPTGLAVGADGRIFVAINGNSPDQGSVVLIGQAPAPVPLPASGLMLAGAALSCALLRRRRRA